MFASFSFASIHADAPEFVDMSVEQEILETGIKVVDLLAPYAKGGKIGEPLWYLLTLLTILTVNWPKLSDEWVSIFTCKVNDIWSLSSRMLICQ